MALDQFASSDIIVRFQENGALYVAASRILYNEVSNCNLYPPSPTLRNSVNGSYENTELNKLYRAVQLFDQGSPVILPRYLCYARVYPKEAPTAVYDLLAIETIPLIKHVFSSSGLNLPELRRKQETEKEKVLFDEKLPWAAGIQINSPNTFLFMGVRYLEQCGLPYLYKKL